jgi:hypothetical protein
MLIRLRAEGDILRFLRMDEMDEMIYLPLIPSATRAASTFSVCLSNRIFSCRSFVTIV